MRMSSTFRRALGAAVLALGLSGFAAAAEPVTSPWWAAFQDPTLDRLLGDGSLDAQASRGAQLALQARVSSLYLQVRIYSVRLQTALAVRRTQERQWALLQQGGQADTDVGRATGILLRQGAQREQAFVELRSQALEALGELLRARYPARELAALLAPVLDDIRLPVADIGIPEGISGLVLRQRSDVAEAEATLLAADGSAQPLRLAEYLQALGSTITPGEAAAAEPADDAFGRVLQHARAEVAARFAQLAAQGEAVGTQAGYVQALGTRYDQVLQGYRQGLVPELEALSGLQHLLQEEDRLAASIGLAGLAWIAFQESIGGAGEARTSDLLGAGASGP